MNDLGRLRECKFKPARGPESVEHVAELERRIGVPLPPDYRAFLLETGGGYLEAVAPCTVATPFGRHNLTVLHDVDEVVGLLHSSATPRNMICVGYGHFGMTTCLSVAGLDHGQVFSLDTQMRFYNWDDEALARMPHLAPEIREFFRMRDADELPERPWGYENCYHIADSFAEFLRKIQPVEEP